MESDIELCILQKMLARRAIGSHPVSEENLHHWHWKPDEKSLIKKAIKTLINKGHIKVVDKSKKLIVLNPKIVSTIVK